MTTLQICICKLSNRSEEYGSRRVLPHDLSTMETWKEDRAHKHRTGSTALSKIGETDKHSVGERDKVECKLRREERRLLLVDDDPDPNVCMRH